MSFALGLTNGVPEQLAPNRAIDEVVADFSQNGVKKAGVPAFYQVEVPSAGLSFRIAVPEPGLIRMPLVGTLLSSINGI